MSTVDEVLRVENYKIKQFLRMGFSITEAYDAVTSNVDWHDVEDLIDKGCDPAIAVEILT